MRVLTKRGQWLAGISTAAALAGAAQAQEAVNELDVVIVTGTRTTGLKAIDSPAPIQVLGNESLARVGQPDLNQALAQNIPSFTAQATGGDTSNMTLAAKLRGVSPNHALVLVNGKRRHGTALLNLNGTQGRGSSPVDLNAIPIAAIQRVEVLRDGASAQYGSDAIAGVINIVLKKGVTDTQLSASAGTTSEGDGDTYTASAHKGFPLGLDGGYLNLSVEGRRRNETNRAGPDLLRVNPPRVTQRIGDSLAKDGYLWMNAALPVGGGELYAFGGASKRKGDASGFFRSAGDARNVPAVYPNGFLPNIITTVKDASLALGYKHDLTGDWSVDLSVNHGRSELGFHERNSINVSYYYENGSSPLEADTGKLKFDQTTLNLDFKGSVDFAGAPLYIGTGFEWRQDNYQIVAGDPVSYQYGRTNDPRKIIRDQTGGIAASGIQGFPGYTPGTEVEIGRAHV